VHSVPRDRRMSPDIGEAGRELATGTGRLQTVVGAPPAARLLAFGSARPDDIVSGHALGAPFGKPMEWVERRTGIRQVRRARRSEHLVELAELAGRRALATVGGNGRSVDLVIVATCSAQQAGMEAARRLAPTAPAFTLNGACSGFCYALQAADGFVRTGSAGHVLILAVEHMSALIDGQDLGTSIIFGDGAGAAVVGPTEVDSRMHVAIGPTVSGSDGGREHLIAQDADDPNFLRMAGQDVFRWAIDEIPAIAREACRRADVTLADVEVFVPHQANLRIIDSLARSLELEHAVIADDIVLAGNTSAASIPMAVDALLRSGRARSGQLALFVGFGAGLAYAAQVVTLP